MGIQEEIKVEQDTKDKKKIKSKSATVILGIILAMTILLVVGMRLSDTQKGPISYKLGQVAFEFPKTRGEYIGTNKDQIIRITKDGITAYDLTGQEVWTDTLTLDKIVVKQKEPYIAVTNTKDRKISIFSDKGKEGDIVTEAPVLYFSINKNGDVATIEETKDGHMVAAYDKSGVRIPGKRVTHIETAGFPIAVEIAPNRSLLLVSYIDIYSPVITTKVVGVLLDVQEEQAVDNIKFGNEIQDNIIYEIEYITDQTWAAIGDKGITYYDQDGKIIKEIGPKYLRYTPYVHSGMGVAYLPIMESSIQGQSMLYGKQTLSSLNAKGEVIWQQDFEGAITYYYPDEKGIIVGQGKEYRGYDTEGKLKFTLHASQDIEEIRYLGRKPIAITKNEVILLEVVEEVKQ